MYVHFSNVANIAPKNTLRDIWGYIDKDFDNKLWENRFKFLYLFYRLMWKASCEYYLIEQFTKLFNNDIWGYVDKENLHLHLKLTLKLGHWIEGSPKSLFLSIAYRCI